MPRHPGHKARCKPRNAKAHDRAAQTQAQTQTLTPKNKPHWDDILTDRACYHARETDRYAYIQMAYSMGFSGKRILELKLMDMHKDAGPHGPHERVTLNKLLFYPKFDKR